MMGFIRSEPPIDCSAAGRDWVECRQSRCAVKPEITAARGPVTCDYKEIVRTDDYAVRYRDFVRTTEAYRLQASDFVHVKCWDETWAGWSGILFGLREQPAAAVTVTKRDDTAAGAELPNEQRRPSTAEDGEVAFDYFNYKC